MTDQLTNYLNSLILLLMCHLIGDFVLQSSVMAEGKQPSSTSSINSIWWLTAHGATHGFLVIIVTGIPLLGLAEWLIHSLIDHGKCINLYSFNTDQFLHFICKIVWSGLAISVAPITLNLLK
tara:strand:+ start:145 stop:510 length:366 start_codon:yes stop_codon:yes gene_type:complete